MSLNTDSVVIEKTGLTIRTQVLDTLLAVAGAVVIPQIFHLIGAISGAGNALGETFLPMHLPIMLVGLLAGPFAGAAAGLLGPLVSFAISGMPGAVMLPFMMIELCIYGLTTGLLRTASMPTAGKVVIAQVTGRAVRAGAMFFSIQLLGNTAISQAMILGSIRKGLPGLVLQWAFLPLIVFWFSNRNSNEKR